MACTEAYKEHIMYTFNGYCKTVIRFAAINAWRDRSRRRQKEISLEYLTEEKFYLKAIQNKRSNQMTENRRFYYLKLKENFYNSETMVILESMQDGLLYSNLLLKMYLMSLKSNGVLLLNDYLPHDGRKPFEERRGL